MINVQLVTGLGEPRACQFCRQVDGLPEGIALASPIRRFCGYLIERLLMLGTFVIGYLIWMCFTFRVGQTPGKKLLDMRVVSLNRKQATTFWGTLLRDVIAKPIIGAFGAATAGLIYLWLIWDRDNQEFWGRIAVTCPPKTGSPALLVQRMQR